MPLPLYKDHAAPPQRPAGGHAGLWFQRFFDAYTPEWQVNTLGKDWLDRFKGACGDPKALERAAARQAELGAALGGRSRVFRCDWRFATGLGLPHPVENGLAWHPTLGVPYLCGAGVKGLLRAWVECWEKLPEARRRQRDWFGDTERAGGLVYFDALPLTQPALAVDVMTPHLGKWYEQGGDIRDPGRQPERLPADWHDPVPVPFLVVEQASFVFTLAPRGARHAALLEPALEALEAALGWLGAGAKTAVGYGHMSPDPKAGGRLEELLEQGRRDRRQAAAQAAREAELAAMDPFERDMEACIDAADLEPYLALLKALQEGRWTGEQARRVAQRIRALMQEKNLWRPQSQKKNPAKDKEHQRTLGVMQWLQ